MYSDRKETKIRGNMRERHSPWEEIHKIGRQTKKQCCGSGIFIPDPRSGFFHPGSRIQGQKDSGSWVKKIPDPASRFKKIPSPGCGLTRKNISIFNPKIVYKLSRIPDPDPDVLPIPDSGSTGQKGTGSRIQIRNTATKKKWKREEHRGFYSRTRKKPEEWDVQKGRTWRRPKERRTQCGTEKKK